MRAQTAPKRAPEYNLIRVVTAADGAADYKKKSNGCNFGSYLKGCFQVVPINTATPGEVDGSVDLITGATSTPTVVLRFWNDVLGMFVIHNPTIAPAAIAAGAAFEMDFDAIGRIVMPEVTGGVTGGQGVLIFASGIGHNEALG
jgi:hypothetical protein